MVVLYSVTGITSFDRYGALNVGTEIGGFLVSNTRGEGDYTVGRVVRLEFWQDMVSIIGKGDRRQQHFGFLDDLWKSSSGSR